MEQTLSNNKWKNGFLKSALPLEYATSNILDKLGHSSFSEYQYFKSNEIKELKEFSVDIRKKTALEIRSYMLLQGNKFAIRIDVHSG